MKCPICDLDTDIYTQKGFRCCCSKEDLIREHNLLIRLSKEEMDDNAKEIVRLKNLIKRFMKAIGKPVRSWMLGNPELMKELLEEVDKP